MTPIRKGAGSSRAGGSTDPPLQVSRDRSDRDEFSDAPNDESHDRSGTGGSSFPRKGASHDRSGSGGSLDLPNAIRGADVAVAAQLACLLEASAPKPGNVSPGHPFADVRYEDFLASAIAIGEPMAAAGTRSVGATVRLAVDATRRWTRSNTNLGIVLLFAPLARAALVEWPDAAVVNSGSRSGAPAGLRAPLRRVLETTTVDDARDVYVAIRQTAPGGLGRVEAQDVGDEPTLSLLEVMRLAAHRDGIAREYATAFDTTFETAVPALERARCDGLTWDDAIVETFLMLLAAAPDTHVARRGGAAVAAEVSRLARGALDAGGVRSAAGRLAIDEMDVALRDERNSGNPGTTADLTAAAIFVVLLGGGWDGGPVAPDPQTT